MTADTYSDQLIKTLIEETKKAEFKLLNRFETIEKNRKNVPNSELADLSFQECYLALHTFSELIKKVGVTALKLDFIKDGVSEELKNEIKEIKTDIAGKINN